MKESVAGVLALMFCTTHLHYTQNMMENNYIMLLTLTGFSYQFEWLRSDSRRALFIGSCALGLNLLTRLTTGLDLIAAGVFVLLVLWSKLKLKVERRASRPSWPAASKAGRGRPALHRQTQRSKERAAAGYGAVAVAYCKIAAPVYLFFLLIDRAYQLYRFGSFTNTYVTIFAREFRERDPSLPANFPWSTPFHVGVLGALFTPEKSIFLFDPLLLLSIFLLAWLWKRLTPEVRAYGVTSLLLLLAYICFYARYTFWSGDFAWGDRYVSTTVELGGARCRPASPALSSAFGPNDLDRLMGADRGQPDDSAGVARLLVAARNLPDGDVRTSDVCNRSAFQEHHRLCSRQDGCLGLEHRCYGMGSVGLCPHHDVEFSALSVAPRRSSTRQGSECGVRHLDRGDSSARSSVTAAKKKSGW
jgi:hypothetical protein